MSPPPSLAVDGVVPAPPDEVEEVEEVWTDAVSVEEVSLDEDPPTLAVSLQEVLLDAVLLEEALPEERSVSPLESSPCRACIRATITALPKSA